MPSVAAHKSLYAIQTTQDNKRKNINDNMERYLKIDAKQNMNGNGNGNRDKMQPQKLSFSAPFLNFGYELKNLLTSGSVVFVGIIELYF